MAEKADEDVRGTVICGADGAVYFIPNQDLEAFRVPEDSAGPVRENLHQPAAEKGIVGTKHGASGIIIVGGVTGRRPVGSMGPTAIPGGVLPRSS